MKEVDTPREVSAVGKLYKSGHSTVVVVPRRVLLASGIKPLALVRIGTRGEGEIVVRPLLERE